MAKQTFSVGQTLTAAQMTSLQQTAMLGGAASAKTASYTLVAADAGTAISMSSASATTITVNTALFAAGDTVQITNLNTGVCTITAGTATVNTSAALTLAQYESGTLAFTSTSSAIFIKGAGAGGGGGMTLLNGSGGTTLSGSTTTIGSISQDYKDLKILVINAVSSNISEIAGLRLNGDTGSNYAYEAYPGYSNAANTVIYYGLTSTSSDWDKTHSGEIVINRYTESDRKFITFFSYAFAGSYQSRIGVGRFNSTTAISSITLTAGAGTFSSGTVYLYGVK
jgi:hypothetical protein